MSCTLSCKEIKPPFKTAFYRKIIIIQLVKKLPEGTNGKSCKKIPAKIKDLPTSISLIFFINMFLNEHCKNAMNLSDFIESLPITDKIHENTIKNGLTSTITNMMVDGLNELDILDRPIHCTDTKRKTMYVKENDVWEKDKELIKILYGIKKTALKNRMNLDKWQDANDGWMVKENIQMKYLSLVSNVMTFIEDEDKHVNKIINAIGKKVYLDEDTKKEYM